jgi:predicted RNA binding protein YcfA (HicA-like mRNA interferase family)
MGEKYPLLSPREIIHALRKIGFEEVSQRGSHLKLQNQTIPKRTVIVPMHRVVARGTLRNILVQAGIELDAFLELL